MACVFMNTNYVRILIIMRNVLVKMESPKLRDSAATRRPLARYNTWGGLRVKTLW